MKVRLLGNMIRLRTKMFETEALLEKGLIEEVIEFGPDDSNKLRFQVRKGIDAFAVEQSGLTIAIILPEKEIETWASTSLIGIEQTITTIKGAVIKILIEKDFACLEERTGEDESDAFPHPKMGQSC